MAKLVYGVGIRDMPSQRTLPGNQVVRCPIYTKWSDMLMRCYSGQFQSRHPSYKGCTVHPEWLTLSSFSGWMLAQDWEGSVLDKDLLSDGGRVYEPDSCAFIPTWLNAFLSSYKSSRSGLPMGVYERDGRYRASHGGGKSQVHIGTFKTIAEAEKAYLTFKLDELVMISARYAGLNCADNRVCQALLDKIRKSELQIAALT